MPSQLYTNSAIYFMCARDFLWDGVEYKMGDKFDQEVATGRIDLLVRTRRLVAVVDEEETEPEVLVHPTEVEEDDEDERVITEEDLYDPSEHTAPDVNDYLDSDISEDERARVIAAERQGKNRKGIVNRG
jgi:hypothetical protein